MFPKAEDALAFYARQRTYDNKGVTIPSQIRYVKYFGKLQKLPEKRPVLLDRIKISPVPIGGCTLSFRIKKQDHSTIYRHFKNGSSPKFKESVKVITLHCNDFEIEGDVKFEFRNKGLTKETKLFHFWINTYFIENNYLCLRKHELDGAVSDKKHRLFPENFQVELFFNNAKTVPALPPRPHASTSMVSDTATLGSSSSTTHSDSDTDEDEDEDTDDERDQPKTPRGQSSVGNSDIFARDATSPGQSRVGPVSSDGWW
eukprot:GEZU01021924.1.p1 GENE.GEZU01021924.1~~GEZU01021924.1.p1  ORF type:complete len:258 (+),score=64.84 GEZU01021924.1:842-1615(+)